MIWNPMYNRIRVEPETEKMSSIIETRLDSTSDFQRYKVVETGPLVGFDLLAGVGWVKRQHGRSVKIGDRVLICKRDVLEHKGADGTNTYIVSDNFVLAVEEGK